MQIITPRGLAIYAYVFRPQKPMQEGKEPQFALTLVWEPDANLSKLRKAVEKLAVEKWGPKAKKMLASGQLKNPIRNADDEGKDDNELLAGKLFLTARTSDKPGVVDEDGEPLMSQEEFYSGCEARMDLWLYPFDKAGNKGIAAILNNVQKLDDGERLSGRRSASEAFGGGDDDDDEDEAPKKQGKKKPIKRAATTADDDDDDEPDDDSSDDDEDDEPPPQKRKTRKDIPPRGKRG